MSAVSVWMPPCRRLRFLLCSGTQRASACTGTASSRGSPCPPPAPIVLQSLDSSSRCRGTWAKPISVPSPRRERVCSCRADTNKCRPAGARRPEGFLWRPSALLCPRRPWSWLGALASVLATCFLPVCWDTALRCRACAWRWRTWGCLLC